MPTPGLNCEKKVKNRTFIFTKRTTTIPRHYLKIYFRRIFFKYVLECLMLKMSSNVLSLGPNWLTVRQGLEIGQRQSSKLLGGFGTSNMLAKQNKVIWLCPLFLLDIKSLFGPKKYSGTHFVLKSAFFYLLQGTLKQKQKNFSDFNLTTDLCFCCFDSFVKNAFNKVVLTKYPTCWDHKRQMSDSFIR